MRYQVDEILSSRLEEVEEEVEGLVTGRVAIDVSYQGLETRQMEDHEQIAQLRDELPEIRDRAQMTQEAQGHQAHKLALARDRLAIVEGRELATRLQVHELTALVASLTAQVRELQSRLGGAPGGA